MFDLEQSIAAWRQQMLAAGIRTPELLDELEGHLREETERQISAGVATQQAFESAIQQIGSAGALKAEFEKVRFFTPSRLRRWGTVAYLAELAAYTSMQWRYLLEAYPTRHDLILGAAGLAATLGAAYAIWRLAPRVLSRISSKTARSWVAIAVCASPLVWLIVLAQLILPNLALNTGQLAVVFLWAMIPMITFPAVMIGLDQPEGHRAQ